MSYAVAKTEGATTRQANTAVTGAFANQADGFGTVIAAGATFVTNGVRRGDLLRLLGTRESTEITTIAASGITGGDYFNIYTPTTHYVFYAVKAGVGSAPGVGTVEVAFSFTGTAANTQVMLALVTAVNSTGQWNVSGTGATRTFQNKEPGPATDTSDGALPTGFTFTKITDGTTGSGNDGVYVIERVISETTLLTRLSLPAPGAAAGNLEIRNNDSTLLIDDEASITWAAILAASPEFVHRSQRLGHATQFNFYRYDHFFKTISVNYTTAGVSQWNHSREIISCLLETQCTVKNRSGSSGTLNIQLGTTGSDLLSGRNASVWVNMNPEFGTSGHTTNLCGGSSVYTDEQQVFDAGKNANVSGAIVFSGGFTMNNLPNGAGGNLDTLIIASGSFPYIAFNTQDSADNLIVVDSTNAAIFVISSGNLIQVPGLRLSDDAFRPIAQTLFATVIFLDPKEDYAAQELYALGGTPAAGQNFGALKKYTFNPSFVLLNRNNLTRTPINSLQVRIYEIEEERIVSVNTNTNGTYEVRVTVNGTLYTGTFTASGHTTTQIRNGLVTSSNGTGGPFSASSTEIGGIGLQLTFTDPEANISISLISPNNDMSLRNNVSEMSGSPFTTDSNGQLESGAGIQVIRAKAASSALNVRHRIVTSGANIQRLDAVVKITQKFTGDISMDLSPQGFEGEGAR